MTNPVRFDHINLTVRNYREAVEWYGKVFGFIPVEEGLNGGEPWGTLRSGDSMLCIYQSPERTHIGNSSGDEDRLHHVYHFGIRLTDEKKWAEIVRSEKLETFYGSPIRYPHSKSWYVKDPTGQMIEVSFWDEDRVRF